MSNPDSIRPRKNHINNNHAEARRAPRKTIDEPEFRETLAAPVPNRTYRSEVDLTESRAAVTEQIIRFATALLSALLAIRFIVSLFTSDRGNALAGFFYATTDWLVRPFQAVLGQPPAGSEGLGFFDWPALAALALTLLVATLLIRFIRRPKV
jgi:uncharacterized protein YggT (Ycf19 family)